MGRNKKSVTKKEAATNKPDDVSTSGELLVPTGSTLLNLACSDKSSGGYATGKMVNVVGDSSAGKTIVILTGLAEMCRLSKFDEYEFDYDDAESALEFDFRMFGGLEERMNIEYSETIQDVQRNVIKRIETGTPFVYVLDSLDVVSSDEEQQLIADNDSSSYRMGKARALHQTFRTITAKMKKTSSLFIVISQTRDKIGSRFPMKYRTGERALEFYSSHVIWLNVAEKLQRGSKVKRQVGITTRARVTKNRITGKSRTVTYPIYPDYGIDDVGSMVDFLVSEGEWTKTKQSVNADDFKFIGTREKLIAHIEDGDHIDELISITEETWKLIENELSVNKKRPGRFA